MLHPRQQCPEEDERHTDDAEVDAAAAGDVDVDDPPYIQLQRWRSDDDDPVLCSTPNTHR